MLVQRDQLPERAGGEPFEQQNIAWSVPIEFPMRSQPLGSSFLADFIERLSKSQRLGLGKHIGHEQFVMSANRIERVTKRDKVAWDQSCALVDQLIKRVLAIRTRLAPVNRPGVIVHMVSCEGHALPIALHRQLLEVSWESFHVLIVRQYRDRRCLEEIVVPDSQKRHEDRDVAMPRCCPKMLVHLSKAMEHRMKILRANCDHGRKPNGRVHRIPATDPIPKAEHVGRIDSKLGNLCRIGRNGDKVLCNRLLARPEPLEQPVLGRLGIGHRLLGREGLRCDNEQGLGWIQALDSLGEIRSVDVRYE